MTDGLRPATVQYYKWDGKLHWRHDFVLLGNDEYGRWLGGRHGAVAQRGDEPPVRNRVDVVQLVPRGQGWTAMFQPDSDKYPLYVDIISEPCWVGDDRVEMIDMDLDVVRTPGGETRILDEDEFADHIDLMGYPDDVVATTRATADRVAAMVRDRIEPFDRAAEVWLDALA